MTSPAPITATPTKERQIDSQQFTIRKQDHEKALALFSKILKYQQAHPEIYYYTRTRVFFREDPNNSENEFWMFMDEYDNREVYWEALMNAATTNPESASHLAAWKALIVPPAPEGHIVWTEAQELRVQYKSREPLYPCATEFKD